MKKILILFMVCILTFSLSGCYSDAEQASSQISKEADEFKVYRNIKIINCKTDKVLVEFSGWCSINVDHEDKQLEITYKTGKDKYAKDFIGLSNYVTYTITQVESSHIDKFHYEWSWDD